jgi:hypothetical protein
VFDAEGEGEQENQGPALPSQEPVLITLEPLVQHVCCRYGLLAEKRHENIDIWIALPKAGNHSDIAEVHCPDHMNTTRPTKEQSACDWCTCMWEEGAKKHTDLRYTCCSLKDLHAAGHDPDTGWPYCQAQTHVYNIETDRIRVCENNVELFDYSENYLKALLEEEWIRGNNTMNATGMNDTSPADATGGMAHQLIYLFTLF